MEWTKFRQRTSYKQATKDVNGVSYKKRRQSGQSIDNRQAIKDTNKASHSRYR